MSAQLDYEFALYLCNCHDKSRHVFMTYHSYACKFRKFREDEEKATQDRLPFAERISIRSQNMEPQKLLAIAALALSAGKDIAGLSEVEFCEKMGLENEYYGGAQWAEMFLYFYQLPTVCGSEQGEAAQ